MPNIIGRQDEINILAGFYKLSKASFIALYGRRRVGKTYLINEFFKNKGIFFELTGTKRASKKEQLRNFHREFLTQFPQTHALTVPIDWGEAFDRLNKAINEIDEHQKVIIFLDELPWLASPRSGFLASLEYIWNRHFSRRNNLILVICGSAGSWMIKKIINNKEGLYGRLTYNMPLFPFSLQEVEDFLQAKNINFNRKQIVELYMVTGGIGAYLEHVLPGKSVMQIINELCFKPSAPLFIEFNNLFQSLFNHSEKHINIVKTLAKKRRGLSHQDLLKAVKLPQSGRTSEILGELESCGFITSMPKFGMESHDKKYRLIDEYSYFYLAWVEKEYSAIMRGSDPEYWHKVYTSSAWESWAGYAFENICLKHIVKIKNALGISSVKTTESHWQYKAEKGSKETGAEIDLIIDRADSCINLCEIKFSNSPFRIDKQYAKNLINKREVFRNKTGTNKSIFITFITPYGVVENDYYRELVQSQILLDDLF